MRVRASFPIIRPGRAFSSRSRPGLVPAKLVHEPLSHYRLGAMANSPARAPIDVGSVIAGTYKVEALLGRGGMGAVFLASHQRLAGKQVAIKILHTEIEDADVV